MMHQEVYSVGEHWNLRQRWWVTIAGAISKENVGISNDKAGEKPARQKSKVSWSTLIGSGLAGSLGKPERGSWWKAG